MARGPSDLEMFLALRQVIAYAVGGRLRPVLRLPARCGDFRVYGHFFDWPTLGRVGHFLVHGHGAISRLPVFDGWGTVGGPLVEDVFMAGVDGLRNGDVVFTAGNQPIPRLHRFMGVGT